MVLLVFFLKSWMLPCSSVGRVSPFARAGSWVRVPSRVAILSLISKHMCQQCYEKGLYEADNHAHTLQDEMLGFKLMGKFFGYPQCCIDFFVERARNIKLATSQAEFDKACDLAPEQRGYNMGFIPCVECAKKYPPGQEFALIKDRVCSEVYPHGSTYAQFEQEFDAFIQSQFKN